MNVLFFGRGIVKQMIKKINSQQSFLQKAMFHKDTDAWVERET